MHLFHISFRQNTMAILQGIGKNELEKYIFINLEIRFVSYSSPIYIQTGSQHINCLCDFKSINCAA